MTHFTPIEDALTELRAGRMIILVDDERREQEGDIVIAAEKITPESINFLIQYARGFICMPITNDIASRLNIPLMPERNKNQNQAPFTVTIEAAQGVTTGVSVQDRAHTIRVAVNPDSQAADITTPGHIFPLLARSGGVLERPGHTEGSIDLMKLAGLQPAAVICEIMKDDGKMARLPDLLEFAKTHQIKIVSINDLIDYRLTNEVTIEEIANAPLPLKIDPDFTIKIFRDCYTNAEHIALIHGDLTTDQPHLVRIHSECLTGDAFGSLRCDCGEQLQQSLEKIAKEGGVLLYMRQEGRGIGLANKIKAYELQSQGLDTVEANQHLGFLADHRCYGLSAQILKYLGVTKIRLMTNNPKKVDDMQRFGLQLEERIAIEVSSNDNNDQYLKTKRDKLGHWFTTLDKE